MQQRYLGNSGLKVSEISYGNWITHGSQVEDAAARACVARALELGITTFDTADVYAGTRAEVVLGEALEGVRRDSIEIMTKVYWPTSSSPNGWGLSRKHIMESIDGSLRRLGTDYVDVYQAHRFDHDTPLEETMVAFADLVRQGKVLYVGVSEWTAGQLEAGAALAAELRLPFVSNQPQYSMLWRVIEPEVIPASKRLGIGQVVWSPLAQGVLTGKYTADGPLPSGSRAQDTNGGADFVNRWLRPEVLEAVASLVPLAEQAGLSMVQLALAWVLREPNVSSAIVGASRPEQLEQSVSASGITLDDDLVEAVDAVLAPVVINDPAQTAKQSPESRM